MSDRQEAQQQRTHELVVPVAAEVEGPEPTEAPADDRPLLSVALGNVVLTEHAAEVTLVFPREVVFFEPAEEPTQE